MSIEVSGRYEKVWKPHKVQAEFASLPFSFFEALYGGAAGGGKSELLLMLPILYGMHEFEDFQGIIFRQTFPQLQRSLIPRSHPLYKPLGGRYNDQKHFWKFPSGSTIFFSHLETYKDALEHDTAEYQYVGFDELTAFAREVYLYIISRCRGGVGGIPAFTRGATNPGNIGHLWVRNRFVVPHPAGRVRVYDPLSETSRIFIPALLTDNPFLQAKDPGYLKRLQLLPSEAERRAKIHGDWWVFAGQVFEEWRDPFAGTTFKDEPENACHVIEDFIVPVWWPRIVAVDWGFSANTWIGWGAVSPDSRLFLYREYCHKYKRISEWGADLRRLSQGELEFLKIAVLDPSAWARRGEEKTIVQQAVDASGMRFEKADNDRIGGKLWLHELLRWKQRPPAYVPRDQTEFELEVFEKIRRNQGTAPAVEYYDSFQPEKPETNTPRLQVFKSCQHFREVIPTCVYDEKDGHVAEDVKEFRGDDPYDGGRYLGKAFHRLIELSIKEGNIHDRLSNIIQTLEESGDWNRYYRQMDKHEHGEGRKVVGVYRGRRRGMGYVAH